MTVLVFLRSSFGYSYLRPKSVFFAFSWAFVLFFVYARYEKEVWAEYGLMCLYGAAAVALYLIHLLTAFFRELFRDGTHDHDSGTPHTLRLLRALGRPGTARFEMLWHIWVEPAFVFFAGLFLGVIVKERHLSYWLVLTAPCLSVKEVLNYWFQVRQKKRHQDSRDDAEDIFDDQPTTSATEAPKPVGKAKIKRARASRTSAANEIKERQFAQILRLMPPYQLDEAEQNYKKLIKQAHPDPNQDLNSDEGLAAQLNEAIAFFRNTLG
ncbi:MAG: hypothetical protein OJI67_13785 [Prosthecobacter sp.]|nr:hypothetical protein [Prosthecobacter sp.]